MLHHACLHAVAGEVVFRTDEDRIAYLLWLAAAIAQYGWRCLMYCLMGNHLHLLVETPQANFAEGMRWLHGRYGAEYNRHHRRDGHLFRGRYHDEPILTEGHLLKVVPYIALNPVKHGFCSDPADWPWGSHHRAARGEPAAWTAHDDLVDRLEAATGSRAAYERLVEVGLRAY
jgi:REP element-mobilizing transposase RayT